MKKLYTFSIGLIVLLLMAASASAASSSDKSAVRTYTNSNCAYADFINEDSYSTIYVLETADWGTDVYVSFYGFDTNGVRHEFSGLATTKDDVFNFDKKLNSASLSETPVEVYDCVAENYKTVTVKAEWIGEGEITRDKYISQNSFYSFRGSGSSRSATATVSIIDSEGNDFGGIIPTAGISHVKNMEVTRIK